MTVRKLLHTPGLWVTTLALALLSPSAVAQGPSIASASCSTTSSRLARPGPKPILEIREGVTYQLTELCNWEYLFAVERAGNELQFFTDCGMPYDCDLYGYWDSPWNVVQTGSNTYLVTYIIGTALSEYEFSVQPDGSILVSYAHDQCYFGCSFPPLELIGVFEPIP